MSSSLMTTYVLVSLILATTTLVAELRDGATTLRCVVASGAVVLLPVLFFPAWLILRTVERKKAHHEHLKKTVPGVRRRP